MRGQLVYVELLLKRLSFLFIVLQVHFQDWLVL